MKKSLISGDAKIAQMSEIMLCEIQELTAKDRTYEEVLAESALKDGRLERAQHIAHVGFWELDVASGGMYWSSELYAITGLSPETDAVLYQHFLDCIHHEDRQIFEMSIQKILQDRKARSCEYRIVERSGFERCMYQRLNFESADADGVDRLIGTIQDITALRQHEYASKQSFAELNQIFNNSANGLCVLDLYGNCLKVNMKFTIMTGLTEEDTYKCRFDEIFICPGKTTSARSIERIIGGEEVFEEELAMHRKDGTVIHCLRTVSPLRNSEGNPYGIIENFTDISSRVQLEELLRHSQKMDAIGQLVGGIAHEFNNLLTAIMGQSELGMKHLSSDSIAYGKFAIVRDIGVRAAELIKGLLAFGRKQVLDMKPVNISTVIAEMIDIHSRTIGKHIEIEFANRVSDITVIADKGQLEQIFLNLAVNARDAMPQGGRLIIDVKNLVLDKIDSSRYGLLEPGRYVELTVTDTGCGMSADIADKIFEPFFTTKDVGKGTGLGLATVYGIVKQHGGHISVYSEPGVGTSFSIFLAAVSNVITEEIPETEQLRPIPGAETILVVDGDESVAIYVGEMLTSLGYRVITPAYPVEAFSLIEQHGQSIDLLLTGMVMPKCSGTELAAHMRIYSTDVCVLYMSGFTDKMFAHEDISVPRVGYLQKPFDAIQLTNALRSLLDRRYLNPLQFHWQ